FDRRFAINILKLKYSCLFLLRLIFPFVPHYSPFSIPSFLGRKDKDVSGTVSFFLMAVFNSDFTGLYDLFWVHVINHCSGESFLRSKVLSFSVKR
ncbi:MAG TPA: hypothetical protein VFC67_00280, partial [Prolixibacteraceae bacterium]|nr:hypothetical protein [Prolixibacteraceae bacterium]